MSQINEQLLKVKMESIISKYKIMKTLGDHLMPDIKSIFIFSANEVLIITKDDKIYAFGDNNSGRLGLSPNKPIETPKLIKELCDKNIVNISYGDNYVFARTDDRKIYCWGFNRFGQLANGKIDPDFNGPEINDFLSDKNIIEICCGSCHSLALTESGEVFAWGWNGWGQIGIGNNINQSETVKVKGFESMKMIAISCGSEHSIALSECGYVFSWGRNCSGQLGFEYDEDIVNNPIRERVEEKNTPQIVRVRGDQKENVIFRRISCGQNHCLLLSSDGDLYVFGSNSFGQLGNNSGDDQYIPIKLNIPVKFIDIASHSKLNISIALSKEDCYYVWGKCGNDIIRIPTESEFKSFDEIFANYFHITYKLTDVHNQ